MGKITQSRLKELITYNPDTGVFKWRVSRSHLKAGAVAGSKCAKGYRHVTILGRSYMAHRLAWLYVEGYFPEDGVEIDHIDRNRANNKFSNLRMASHLCNMRNSSVRYDNKSGVRGVWWRAERNKWCAQIRLNGKNKKLGLFRNVDDAAKARLAAEIKNDYHKCCTISSAYDFLKKRGLIT